METTRPFIQMPVIILTHPGKCDSVPLSFPRLLVKKMCIAQRKKCINASSVVLSVLHRSNVNSRFFYCFDPDRLLAFQQCKSVALVVSLTLYGMRQRSIELARRQRSIRCLTYDPRQHEMTCVQAAIIKARLQRLTEIVWCCCEVVRQMIEHTNDTLHVAKMRKADDAGGTSWSSQEEAANAGSVVELTWMLYYVCC